MALVYGLTLGCGGGGEEAPDAGMDMQVDPCEEAVNHSDLAWIQENVFDRSCNLSGSCHTGAATAAGELSLDPGVAEMNLVNQPSDLFPEWDLVVPGSPEESYLLVILSGEPAELINPDIGTMPKSSGLLCQAKRDAIARWIMSL